jgi:hypothetical protein
MSMSESEWATPSPVSTARAACSRASATLPRMPDVAEVEVDPRRWLALLTCCCALFITLLEVSVTNVALPSIGRATGAAPSQLQWVVSGYTLAFGLVPVLAGRLGDDHGRRLMFQVDVGSFAATSMLAGLAPTAGVLIGARVSTRQSSPRLASSPWPRRLASWTSREPAGGPEQAPPPTAARSMNASNKLCA